VNLGSTGKRDSKSEEFWRRSQAKKERKKGQLEASFLIFLILGLIKKSNTVDRISSLTTWLIGSSPLLSPLILKVGSLPQERKKERKKDRLPRPEIILIVT